MNAPMLKARALSAASILGVKVVNAEATVTRLSRVGWGVVVIVFPRCCGLSGRVERQLIHGAPLTTAVVTGMGVYSAARWTKVGALSWKASVVAFTASLSIGVSARIIYWLQHVCWKCVVIQSRGPFYYTWRAAKKVHCYKVQVGCPKKRRYSSKRVTTFFSSVAPSWGQTT